MRQNVELGLKKEIGTFVAMSIVTGCVIGSGIFVKPGIVIAATGSSGFALLAWILGGIITLTGGLTIAEVSTQIPKTGGLYVYLEEVYGKVWGFLAGWVQTLIYGPGVMGALALYFGTLVVNFFNFPTNWEIPVAIITIIFLAVVNSLGTKYGGFIQSAATIGKLIPITLIAVFGIWHGNGQVLGMTSGTAVHAGMGAALLATLWAYDGWALVGFVAGEMKNPAKELPRAIILGLSVVLVAYLSVNIAMLHVLPASTIVKLGPDAAGKASTILFGNVGGKILSIGILISIFGCLNGKILTFPRVPLAMAERGQLPASRVFSKVSGLGTPINATVMQIVLAILLMTLGNADRLSNIAIFAIYIFYVQSFFAVYILRKRNKAQTRTYNVPGYPIVPMIAIVGASFILISTILDTPTDTLYALAITAAGLPVYWILNRLQTRAEVNLQSGK